MGIGTHLGIVSLAGASSFENTYSFEFDGTDDYIDCGTATNLNFTADDPFTISAWFNKPSLSSGQTQTIMSKSTNGTINNGSGWLFWVSSDLVHFRLRDSGTNFHQIRDNNTHPFNTWVHYVVTYDGSRTGSGLGLNLYKNGTKLSNVQKSGNFSSGTGQSVANMAIGARTTQQPGQLVNDILWDGNIDECSIFNSELSAETISSIYNSGVPNDISSISGLVSWWRMGENATWTGREWNPIPDSNGNNDGIGFNMAEDARSTDIPS